MVLYSDRGIGDVGSVGLVARLVVWGGVERGFLRVVGVDQVPEY